MATWIPFAVGIAACVLVLAISSVLAGRAEGAVAAVRVLALCTAPLTLAGVVMVAVGFSPLFPPSGFTTSAWLIPAGIAVGGGSLFSLGYVLGLAASITSLTNVVARKDWAALRWPVVALMLLLAAPGDYFLLGVIGSRHLYEQSNIWIWIDLACGAPVVVGTLILAARTIRARRYQDMAAARQPASASGETPT